MDERTRTRFPDIDCLLPAILNEILFHKPFIYSNAVLALDIVRLKDWPFNVLTGQTIQSAGICNYRLQPHGRINEALRIRWATNILGTGVSDLKLRDGFDVIHEQRFKLLTWKPWQALQEIIEGLCNRLADTHSSCEDSYSW